MSRRYTLRNFGFRYPGGADILRDISAALDEPGLIAIVGPNGAGKSTLLGAMAGLREGYSGSCAYAGHEVRDWNRRALARQVAVVPQSVYLEFPFTAGQVAMMGRTPYAAGLFESPEDRGHVEEAMRATDTLAFYDRDFRKLSGGEKQRVLLASALAQNPETLLLDEPTTFLDVSHQLAIYRLLRRLAAERHLLAVAVTHDLNLALSYCDRVLVLAGGSLAADGPPRDVLTPARIRDVFAVAATLHFDNARPWITYEA